MTAVEDLKAHQGNAHPLKQLLKRHGIRQDAVCRRFGVSAAHLGAILNGRIQAKDGLRHELDALAEELNTVTN
jgi:transcriptional regulator with XRE-family HTH domain